MKGRTLYAAYGSNLNREQMSRRCPTATIAGISEIKNHRLLFRGAREAAVATVEPCKGRSVPVLAWQLTDADVAALDRYEGFPFLYRKKQVRIKLGCKYRWAMAYVMNEGAYAGHQYPLGQPSPSYYATIMQGYSEAGFDVDVLRKATVESTEQR